MRVVYTMGQVADICDVTTETVRRWFDDKREIFEEDSQRLNGYRISRLAHRRIPKEELVRFLKVHNMYETYRDRLI